MATVSTRFIKTISFCLFAALSVTGCNKAETDDPISALNGLVKEYGFIGYENPLDESGTGTMLAGRPTALSYIASSNECFPHEILDRNYDTQHFNRTYNYAFQGNLGFTVFGSSLFSAGLGLNKTHTVNVEINGVTIEYLSSIQITDWYRNAMSSTCKEYLDDVGFVIQALTTDSMKISITQLDGVKIDFTEDNITQFIDIEAGVNYSISDQNTIEITTPKYIGYQLGRLRMEDEGRTLYRAVEAVDDQFIFEAISLFPDNAETAAQKGLSELDKNSVFLK